MPVRVSIIIPNWNGLRHLSACLTSLLHQTYPDYETVLVDNGSTDGSCQFVADRFPEVHVVRAQHNLGFARGTNLGILHGKGPYVATLNNDTEVEPTWLEHLVTAMSSDPRLGMAASKMLFRDRRTTVNSAGIAVDRAGIAWDRDGGGMDRPEAQMLEVFGPCAGAGLYRRAMLDEIGLFDENFHSYLEDVDLAWRGQAVGWRCIYVPSARVYHIHSATGHEGSPLKSYLLGRNKWWTIAKNYPWPQIATHAPMIMAYDLVAAMYGLVTRNDLSGLRGRLAAFRSWPDLRRKRRAIQHQVNYSPPLAFECLSPLESPLRVWQRYRHL
jgi:GT2 family glycosyltransferase